MDDSYSFYRNDSRYLGKRIEVSDDEFEQLNILIPQFMEIGRKLQVIMDKKPIANTFEYVKETYKDTK